LRQVDGPRNAVAEGDVVAVDGISEAVSEAAGKAVAHRVIGQVVHHEGREEVSGLQDLDGRTIRNKPVVTLARHGRIPQKRKGSNWPRSAPQAARVNDAGEKCKQKNEFRRPRGPGPAAPELPGLAPAFGPYTSPWVPFPWPARPGIAAGAVYRAPRPQAAGREFSGPRRYVGDCQAARTAAAPKRLRVRPRKGQLK